MDDEAQRGEGVAVADLLGELQQPHEHGRHHEDGIDTMLLDQPQHLLGIEARHDDEDAAEPAGTDAEGVRGGMIERPWQQGPHAWLQTIDEGAQGLGGLCPSGEGARRFTPFGFPVVPEV